MGENEVSGRMTQKKLDHTRTFGSSNPRNKLFSSGKRDFSHILIADYIFYKHLPKTLNKVLTYYSVDF